LGDCILFGLDEKIIDLNLLTKDKIKRRMTNVEKALKMGGGFDILMKSSICPLTFQIIPIRSLNFFKINFVIKIYFYYFLDIDVRDKRDR
jgi:hypothetical protein